jgi:hypothetical protein
MLGAGNSGARPWPGRPCFEPSCDQVPQLTDKPNPVPPLLSALSGVELRRTTTIPLVPALLPGSSDRPGSSDGPPVRPKPRASLFGLAPCGVLPATSVTRSAVRSYRTFSPLLRTGRVSCVIVRGCGVTRALERSGRTFPPLPRLTRPAWSGIFSVPLVRRVAPPGCYPAHCPGGVRTFLSRRRSPAHGALLAKPPARGLTPAAVVWSAAAPSSVASRESGVGSRESGVGSRESGVGSRGKQNTEGSGVE